jgi:hypothetical protein
MPSPIKETSLILAQKHFREKYVTSELELSQSICAYLTTQSLSGYALQSFFEPSF